MQFEVSSAAQSKGPGTRSAGFYNSEQVTNRDITLLALSVIRPRLYLDGFGGTGIRAIRANLELGIRSVVSETNPVSVDLIRHNVERNSAEVDVIKEPFQAVVSKGLYDFIDIDPYGSAIPYLDEAIYFVRNGGYIGVTATDLSALTGSVPSKTRRRYGAYVANDRHRHEMGIRLLLADVCRRAAAMDRYVDPVISFWRGHYYRVIFRVKNGSARADAMLKEVSTVNKRKIFLDYYADTEEGPVWRGNLENVGLLDESLRSPGEYIRSDTLQLVRLMRHEDTALLFWEITDMARYFRKSLPPVSRIIETMEGRSGIRGHRTHFSSTGVKFSGEASSVISVFNSIAVT